MCNFCAIDKILRKGREIREYKYSPTVFIRVGEDNTYELWAVADDETHFPIDFCPVCGRNLTMK